MSHETEDDEDLSSVKHATSRALIGVRLKCLVSGPPEQSCFAAHFLACTSQPREPRAKVRVAEPLPTGIERSIYQTNQVSDCNNAKISVQLTIFQYQDKENKDQGDDISGPDPIPQRRPSEDIFELIERGVSVGDTGTKFRIRSPHKLWWQ